MSALERGNQQRFRADLSEHGAEPALRVLQAAKQILIDHTVAEMNISKADDPAGRLRLATTQLRIHMARAVTRPEISHVRSAVRKERDVRFANTLQQDAAARRLIVGMRSEQ